MPARGAQRVTTLILGRAWRRSRNEGNCAAAGIALDGLATACYPPNEPASHATACSANVAHFSRFMHETVEDTDGRMHGVGR